MTTSAVPGTGAPRGRATTRGTRQQRSGGGGSGGGGARVTFRCAECGWVAPRWVGRCGECQAWGSVEQAGAPPAGVTMARPVAASARARPIAEVDPEPASMWRSGVEELDRVLGGGLVSGAVVLLAGEPGVGKSTLLLDVASRAAAQAKVVLYITGEESTAAVRRRGERIGALRPRLLIAAENDLATVLGHIEEVQPDLLVVDSVQTIVSDAVEGAAGNVTQVREVTASLIRAAKARSMATLLVGHVTKDGSIAGPRVLEHLVDVVCQFEGDRHARLRVLRAVKNRYGPTDEVGCFDLTESGIAGLSDPSALFLTHHAGAVPGSAVTVTLEGRRPLVAEVQALVGRATTGSPRRATSGLDASRVAMAMAVLDKRVGLRVTANEVYASSVGGVRITERSADLAVALAVASSAADVALPPLTVAIGEVGLAGEVRRVPGVGRRLAEAARLGFTAAIVPAGTQDAMPPGMVVTQVADLREAVALWLGPPAGEGEEEEEEKGGAGEKH